jgi:hypothetical protein
VLLQRSPAESRPSQDDFERSVSFSEFIDCIVAQRPENLDPHWCPQYLYLRNTIHHVFRLEDLHIVTKLLGWHTEIPKLNVNRKMLRQLHDAHRFRAFEIPYTNIATESFYNARIRKQVESYYALDFMLMEAVAQAKRADEAETSVAEARAQAARSRRQGCRSGLAGGTGPPRALAGLRRAWRHDCTA